MSQLLIFPRRALCNRLYLFESVPVHVTLQNNRRANQNQPHIKREIQVLGFIENDHRQNDAVDRLQVIT